MIRPRVVDFRQRIKDFVRKFDIQNPDPIISHAIDIIRLAKEASMCRGRPYKHLVPAAVYLAGERNFHPFTYLELSNTANINNKTLVKNIRALRKIVLCVPNFPAEDRVSFFLPQCHKKLVESKDCPIPRRTYEAQYLPLVDAVCKLITDSGRHGNKKPLTIAAVSMYIANKIGGYPFIYKHITIATGVTQATITKWGPTILAEFASEVRLEKERLDKVR